MKPGTLRLNRQSRLFSWLPGTGLFRTTTAKPRYLPYNWLIRRSDVPQAKETPKSKNPFTILAMRSNNRSRRRPISSAGRFLPCTNSRRCWLMSFIQESLYGASSRWRSAFDWRTCGNLSCLTSLVFLAI